MRQRVGADARRINPGQEEAVRCPRLRLAVEMQKEGKRLA
jgi:hypothetical protein